jgi:STIP1 family protein 1
MKATYYLAQAQLGLHQPEDALASALQAYEICLRSDPSSAGPISAFILRAKKERWEVKESERRRLRDPLLAELEEKLETALEEKKLNLQAQFDIGSDQMKTEMERLVDMNRHKIEELRSVFAIADPVELASRVRRLQL